MPRGRSRHGDVTRPPVAPVVNLADYRRTPLFTVPPDEGAEEYQPISIDDDSLEPAGVLRGDVLVAALNQEPEQGRLSYVEARGLIFIGHYFKTAGGVRLERACPDCSHVLFRDSEIEESGPITWRCVLKGQETLQLPFESYPFAPDLTREILIREIKGALLSVGLAVGTRAADQALRLAIKGRDPSGVVLQAAKRKARRASLREGGAR